MWKYVFRSCKRFIFIYFSIIFPLLQFNLKKFKFNKPLPVSGMQTIIFLGIINQLKNIKNDLKKIITVSRVELKIEKRENCIKKIVGKKN